MKRHIYLKVEYGEGYDAEKPYDIDVENGLRLKSSKHLNYSIGTIRHWEKSRIRIVTVPYMHLKEYLSKHHQEVLIISASVGDLRGSFWLKDYSSEIYMITSAGNEDSEGETALAKKPYWTAIAAITPTMRHKDYSSWGFGAVTYSGITGIPIEYWDGGDWKVSTEVTGVKEGTSFSVDQHGAMVWNMASDFFRKFGRDITRKEITATVDKYVTDIGELGFDLKTGKGYYEYREGELYMIPKDLHTAPEWAQDSLQRMVNDGILKGDENGNIHPNEPLTLARYAVLRDRDLGK